MENIRLKARTQKRGTRVLYKNLMRLSQRSQVAGTKGVLPPIKSGVVIFESMEEILGKI